MEVTAVSPIYVASIEWQRSNRTWVLTVVCKATFDLLPGEMRLSDQQEAVNDHDQRYDDDPRRSVHAPGDLAPFKARADVTLVGHAFSPQRERVHSLVARLAVGSFDKSIAVFGERSWSPTGPTSVTPFSRVALRYERAAGGPGTSNPAGVPGKSGATAPPNLEPLRRAPSDDIAPVGFGPIAADWPQRRVKLKQHAKTWDFEAWQRAPLPDDLDGDFFNVAPPDQQLATLRNDEELTLEHLHPDHPRLATRLPGLRPQAYVERPGADPQELLMRADGLWIDTDRALCTVTWRAPLPLAQQGEPGRVLLAMVGPGREMTFADMARLAPDADSPTSRRANVIEDPSSDVEGEDPWNQTLAIRMPKTGEHPIAAPAPALPFEPAPPPQPASPPAASASPPLTQPQVTTTPSRYDADQTYVPGGGGPMFDATPAWLAGNGPPPASTRGAPQAIDRGMLGMPEPASTPRPPVDRSPWAAGPLGAVAAPSATPAPAPAPVVEAPRIPEPPRSSARAAPGEIVDLLWFDPASLGRIRARWPSIIDALDFEPLDPRHDVPAGDPAASRARHHVFGVLTRAGATDAHGIGREMVESVGEGGRFTPPLLLLVGELRFPLDDVEILKTTAACAESIAKDDKRLTDLLASVGELVKSPLLQGSSGVADGMLRELKDAIAQTKRPLPVKYLDAHVERVLLEQRKYQKRTVFGEPCLRALFAPAHGGSGPTIPAYLPEELGTKLPLVMQMKARLLVEAHASQDQYESHPHALRVVALGRTVSVDGARR